MTDVQAIDFKTLEERVWHFKKNIHLLSWHSASILFKKRLNV